jgi:hypothetical protein
LVEFRIRKRKRLEQGSAEVLFESGGSATKAMKARTQVVALALCSKKDKF